jgi:hypothetical protein
VANKWGQCNWGQIIDYLSKVGQKIKCPNSRPGKRRGKAGLLFPSTTKWPRWATRVKSARDLFGQEKVAEPTRICCIQTSPKADLIWGSAPGSARSCLMDRPRNGFFFPLVFSVFWSIFYFLSFFFSFFLSFFYF